MQEHWAAIIEAVGEDLSRPGLADTPQRAARAFEFLTRGYHQSLDEVVNGALFPSDSSEMVLVQNIELYSLCEAPPAAVYRQVPRCLYSHGQGAGLSKVARMVDMYARRLQIQESLTMEIAETIMALPTLRAWA
jgi:GTP cyclohydrolase I